MRQQELKTLTIGATGQDAEGLKYRVVAPLDRGGMGELFIAEVSGPNNLSRHAVVKRLLPDLVEDADYVEMFRDEAEIMAQLNHPNIVQVVGMPILGGSNCLALEYIEGRNVQQLIGRGGQLHVSVPPNIAVHIALCMAEALDHVHHAQSKDGSPLELVHRDVSPGNVLLGFNGDVKLTDFGIAKTRLSNVSTTVGIVKGKARYLAPEQILGKNATAKSDIFSATLVLVEMLTSKPLFERGTIPKTLYAIVNGERPPLSELLPRLASPLLPIMEKALEIDPQKRMPNAQALIASLKEVMPLLGPAITHNELGQHLRGIFEGTKGPVARVITPSPISRSNPGSTPQKTDNSRSQPIGAPNSSPIDPMSTPVGQKELRSRSTVSEVDDALSVLAWLQSRESPPLSPPPSSAHRPATPRKRSIYQRLQPLLLLTTGWGLGLVMAFMALVFLEIRQGPLVPLLKQVESLQPYLAQLGPLHPPGPPPRPSDSTTVLVSTVSFELGQQSPVEFVGPELPPPPPKPPRPEPARLEILGPLRARVIIDGERLGERAPIRGLQLDPGLHHIHLQVGRVSREYDVRFQPGETVRVGRTGVRRSDKPHTKSKAPPANKNKTANRRRRASRGNR